ncbi:MAG: DUF4091 domain-containing protein [Planctomycetes bacterium]|nr:DUF4091 domain-containing protein [Planctomycetota bacterium]
MQSNAQAQKKFAGGNLGLLILVFAAALLLAGPPAWAVTASRGTVKRPDEVLDENGIVLENKHVRLTITTNHYAGQIMNFIYKPTGQDLAPEKHPQGYSTDRMGEDRYFWTRRHSEGYSGEILSQSAEKAEAQVTYLWHYDHNDVRTDIEVTKTYRLPARSATVYVIWKLHNVGKAQAQMSPWVKHVGGRDGTLLAGGPRFLRADGPSSKIDFAEPVTDWVARMSGKKNTENLPMVCSIMDFKKIFQQFCWSGKQRFTLETILRRTQIAPGKSWNITYALSAMPNLGNLAYASPELAASLEPATKFEPRKESAFKVFIAPAMDLGEKRLEGEILDSEGTLVANLPNRQVKLQPGNISRVPYNFTPPGNGVYTVSLTVFDEQQILRLGRQVNSQRSSITIPIVVGPKPEIVVKKWDSEGSAWPSRKKSKLRPWRTVLNGPRLKAAQVRVPKRIFPEHEVVFDRETEPARITAACGEYENLQFVVGFESQDDVARLSAVPGELSGPDGQKILPEALREAIYLTTNVPSGYKNFPVGQWPDPLLKSGWAGRIADASITRDNLKFFKNARKRVFWLGIKVPRDVAAGLYEGSVTLKLAGEKAGEIPLQLQVYDFALPQRPSYRPSTGMVGFKGGYSNWEALGLSKDHYKQLKKKGKIGVDAFWKMALERGWTPTMWSGLGRWKKLHDYGRGITSFATGPGKEAEKWLKDNNLLKYAFAYAPFDEHAAVEVPEVAKWCREFKKKSDIPILDCYYGGKVKPLFGLVDIWLGQDPRSAHWGEPTGALGWGKMAVERKKAGDLFFACNSSLIWHVEYSPIQGRSGFWDDYVAGVDGRYVYSSCRWTKNVYEKNWTSGNYMGCAIYPSPDGYATSIRFETMRDGVEDYDYLSLLKKAIEKAKDAGKHKKLVQEAEKLLGNPDLASQVKNVDNLHAKREEIAKLIAQLNR